MKNLKLIIAVLTLVLSFSYQDITGQNKVDKIKKIPLRPSTVIKSSTAKKPLIKPLKKSVAPKKLNNGNTNKYGGNKSVVNKTTTGKLRKNNSFTKIQEKQLEINHGLATRKGSYTLPFKSSRREADQLGKSFVGPNFEVLKNGKGYLSKDGLKMYRKPRYKKKEKVVRANFQRGVKDRKTGKTIWISNAHLDLK